jgi:hypothetical protein
MTTTPAYLLSRTARLNRTTAALEVASEDLQALAHDLPEPFAGAATEALADVIHLLRRVKNIRTLSSAKGR